MVRKKLKNKNKNKNKTQIYIYIYIYIYAYMYSGREYSTYIVPDHEYISIFFALFLYHDDYEKKKEGGRGKQKERDGA